LKDWWCAQSAPNRALLISLLNRENTGKIIPNSPIVAQQRARNPLFMGFRSEIPYAGYQGIQVH